MKVCIEECEIYRAMCSVIFSLQQFQILLWCNTPKLITIFNAIKY